MRKMEVLKEEMEKKSLKKIDKDTKNWRKSTKLLKNDKKAMGEGRQKKERVQDMKMEIETIKNIPTVGTLEWKIWVSEQELQM